jgi:hypothetical protein
VTPRKSKTQAVEKSEYKIFLKKAKDFHDIMITARDTGNWTATGLNAVHCAISCCDAMLVFHLGIRSIGEDHMEAVDLLSRIPKEIAAGEIATFKRIVAKKNLIAYENREFRQAEALDIVKMTEKFYEWVTISLGA